MMLWSPPPAAAEVALEELRKARLKRTKSIHIFVCPCLLEPVWKSHLWKSADLILRIPSGTPYWNEEMYEPLTIGINFPYLSHRPWHLKGAPSFVELGKRLHQMWKEGDESQGTILRKLWKQTGEFQSMQPQLVFKMLRSFKALNISCP